MNEEIMSRIHTDGARLRTEDAFDFEEGTSMKLHRVPGNMGCDCEIQATSGTAAIKGLALLVIKLAELMAVDVSHIISVLAVILLKPIENK